MPVVDPAAHSSSQLAELRTRGSALDSLFGPRNVAVVGATDREGSVAVLSSAIC